MHSTFQDDSNGKKTPTFRMPSCIKTKGSLLMATCCYPDFNRFASGTRLSSSWGQQGQCLLYLDFNGLASGTTQTYSSWGQQGQLTAKHIGHPGVRGIWQDAGMRKLTVECHHHCLSSKGYCDWKRFLRNCHLYLKQRQEERIKDL